MLLTKIRLGDNMVEENTREEHNMKSMSDLEREKIAEYAADQALEAEYPGCRGCGDGDCIDGGLCALCVEDGMMDAHAKLAADEAAAEMLYELASAAQDADRAEMGCWGNYSYEVPCE